MESNSNLINIQQIEHHKHSAGAYSQNYKFMMQEYPCKYFADLYDLLNKTEDYIELCKGYSFLSQEVKFLESEDCPKKSLGFFIDGLQALHNKKAKAAYDLFGRIIEKRFLAYKKNLGGPKHKVYGKNIIYDFQDVSEFITEFISLKIVKFLDLQYAKYASDTKYSAKKMKLLIQEFDGKIEEFNRELVLTEKFSAFINKLVCDGIIELRILMLSKLI